MEHRALIHFPNNTKHQTNGKLQLLLYKFCQLVYMLYDFF